MNFLYWSIGNLPGLSQQECDRLKACGIEDTKQLLQRTRNPNLKRQLASQLQIHIKYVQKWSALADLAQIPSIGCQYCGLLLHAGIISPTQLRQISVHRLYQQILRLHVSTIQRRDLCPSIDIVQKWVKEAGLKSDSLGAWEIEGLGD
jgi:lipopolysaccharide/colanic/teichoic acid biosynthesis glycosyltransferase